MTKFDLILSTLVVIAATYLIFSKRYEFTIYFMVLLGFVSLTTGIRDIRKDDQDTSAHMRIILFGILLAYFLFLWFGGTFDQGF